MTSKGTVSRSGKVAARERARLAKATLDVERAMREKKIEDAATAFYVADDARSAACQAVGRAEAAMGAAIADLVAQEETVPRIATLCGIDVAEVRRLRKISSNSQKPDGPATDRADEGETAPEPGLNAPATDVLDVSEAVAVPA